MITCLSEVLQAGLGGASAQNLVRCIATRIAAPNMDCLERRAQSRVVCMLVCVCGNIKTIVLFALRRLFILVARVRS